MEPKTVSGDKVEVYESQESQYDACHYCTFMINGTCRNLDSCNLQYGQYYIDAREEIN